MGVSETLLPRGLRLLLAGSLLLFGAEAPAAAQDQSGDHGIVTERLEPLAPPKPAEGATAEGSAEGTEGQTIEHDSRFKRAPFHSLGIPEAPQLIEPVETVPQAGARMRQLDKMTGRTQTFEIAAGAEQQVDRLRIRLDVCRAPADNAQHGTMAFVEIWDSKRADAAPVFSGWMFAESPALSAMDHPRYDVWVISCTTSAGGVATGSE